MSALVQPRRLLTIKETAAALHYSERQVRRLIDEHGLPVLRLGGPGSAPRIPLDGLDEWLQQRRTKETTR